VRSITDIWLLVAAGIAFIIVGVTQVVTYGAFRRRAQRVPGVVVGMTERMSGRYANSVYHPVLEFTTVEGQHVRTTMQVGSRPAPARIGEQVTVAYDPRDSASAEIAGKGWLRMVVGGAMILGGLLFLLLARL
jgi:hypothetical protein